MCKNDAFYERLGGCILDQLICSPRQFMCRLLFPMKGGLCFLSLKKDKNATKLLFRWFDSIVVCVRRLVPSLPSRKNTPVSGRDFPAWLDTPIPPPASTPRRKKSSTSIESCVADPADQAGCGACPIAPTITTNEDVEASPIFFKMSRREDTSWLFLLNFGVGVGFGWCCNPFAGDAANTIKEAYEQYKVFMMVNRSLILSIERIEEVCSSLVVF